MSATASVDASRSRSNGAGPLRAAPPSTSGPRRRRPEMLLGVVLVVGCALAALVLATSGRDRTPVVALAQEVDRGAVIEAGDLTVRYVSADSAIAHVDEADRDSIVGRAALSDLAPGTIVTPELFAEPGGVLEVGDGTVGLALSVGQVPSMDLAPGDLVNVVRAAGDTGGGQVVAAAEVVAASRLEDDSGGWWVSLRTSEPDANKVGTAAASEAQLVLVLVRR